MMDPSTLETGQMQTEADARGVIRVVITLADGDVEFRFLNPVYAKNDTEVSLLTVVTRVGAIPEHFDARLNVNSNSSRESYARMLKECFGKEERWTLLLGRACTSFLAEFERLTDDQIARIPDIVSVPVTNLVGPFIEENAPNIIFGKGGSGKTWLALRMAMSLASGTVFLGEQPEKRVKTLFVDYENHAGGTKHRFDALQPFVAGMRDEDMANLFYVAPKGPLYEVKDSLKRMVEEHGIGLLVIDSAAPALGGPPEDAQTALRYFTALAHVGVTSLTIAHETKAENGNYVFGSVFFHNSARNIWNAKVEREQEGDEIHVGLFHRKSNNAKLCAPRAACIRFGPTGVSVMPESANKNFSQEFGVKSRIRKLLQEGPKELKEICERLHDVPRFEVKNRLSEMKTDREAVNPTKGWWALVQNGLPEPVISLTEAEKEESVISAETSQETPKYHPPTEENKKANYSENSIEKLFGL